MGIINNLKDNSEDKVKDEAKKIIMKKIGTKALVPVFGMIFLIILIVSFIFGLIDLGVELFTAENNPQLIYETLEIEDVAELITIKGDEKKGYYLDFVDGIDEKLEKIIEKNNKSAEYHNLPNDVEFLKKILKAEVYTQFPDLGGTIPDDSKDGFQGAISIKRVTPNKSPRGNERYRSRGNFKYRTGNS